jgi:hypothetical protein
MRQSLLLRILLLLFPTLLAAQAEPRPLVAGEVFEDQLSPEQPSRLWAFEGTTGETISLTIEAKGSLSTALQGNEINVTVQGSGEMTMTLSSSGVYTVVVELVEGESALYSLRLRRAPATPTPIEPVPTGTPLPALAPTTPSVFASLGEFKGEIGRDTLVESALDNAETRHIYQFDAPEAAFALQSVPLDDRIDPIITVYDSRGAAVATDDDTGGVYGRGERAALLDLRLSRGETYYVQVRTKREPGVYRLAFSNSFEAPLARPTADPAFAARLGWSTPVPSVDRLSDHASTTGSIDQPQQVKRYVFEGQAEERVTIAAVPIEGSSLRPRMEVYNPAGELIYMATLESSNANGAALLGEVPLPETGTYSLFVSGDASSMGGYVVGYGRGTSYREVYRGEATLDLAHNSTIDALGLRDVWLLPLNANDIVNLQLSAVNFVPVMELVAPDGSVIAVGGGQIAEARATLNGVYELRVSGAGARSYGFYTFSWSLLRSAGRILTFNDVIPQQAYVDYPFWVAAGGSVYVQVIALDSALDPVAVVLDSEGNTIAAGDDSDNSLNPHFEATLPAGGTYTLRVDGYGDSTGAALVTVDSLFTS